MFSITNLRCEYSVNPLGIDTLEPRFSWMLEHPERGQVQTAYQILVASRPDRLAANSADLWDSGKHANKGGLLVKYAGAPLTSRQRAYWKVRSWDTHDQASAYSEPAWFEIALIHPEDWSAQWIGFPGGRAGKALYFRKAFEVTKPVRSARAYVSGLGWYELRLNGQKVGKAVLDPAQTSYEQRVLYSTYDITGHLRVGQNVVGALVGSGWYGSPKLLAQLEIRHNDGTTSRLITGRMGEGGTHWQVTDEAIVENSVFDGEIYDARLERPGWDTPEWTPSAAGGRFGVNNFAVEAPGGRLTAQVLEPIEVVETITPLARTEPKPGVFVFDVGQNQSGWALLTVSGARGTTVTLRFAEVLRDDGTVDQDNLRAAYARDVYILKGDGVETWEPRFTYHGYRYIQVEGYPGVPALDAVRARVVRSAVASTGAFECDHPLVNQLFRAVWWTEATNLHGLPTDCPQRDERMGWLNDMAARSEEALYNFDLARLFSKWIADISDAQDPDTGAIPDTAPFRWGSRPGDPVIVCYLLIPWLLYRHFGDTRTMAENYAGMRRWVDYLTSRATADHLLEYSYYGDWAPPLTQSIAGSIGASALSRLTPGALVSTAHYYYSAHLFSKIADTLGRNKDAEQYGELAKRIRATFHAQFWDDSAGGYGTNNQACNAIALYFDLVPDHCHARVIDNLVRDVAAHDNHLTTGNLATKYLLEVLAANGHGEVAFKIVTQTTYPSWGFMLENGATTIWERWETDTNTGMNSRNHPMYASVGAWLYRHLAGIQIAKGGHGFSHVAIQPIFPRELNFVHGSVDTMRGKIESAWRRVNSEITLDVSIPVGCTAAISLPLAAPDAALRVDGQPFSGDIAGVAAVHQSTAGALTAVVGAGRYHFTWKEASL